MSSLRVYSACSTGYDAVPAPDPGLTPCSKLGWTIWMLQRLCWPSASSTSSRHLASSRRPGARVRPWRLTISCKGLDPCSSWRCSHSTRPRPAATRPPAQSRLDGEGDPPRLTTWLARSSDIRGGFSEVLVPGIRGGRGPERPFPRSWALASRHQACMGQPIARQAAMEPRQTATSSNPFCFSTEAATRARCPLPQNVTMGRSAGTCSRF